MWIADKWKDYEVIDTSDGEKLERWGDYILVRPDPQVIWKSDKKAAGWKKMNGHYHRSKAGGGEWEFFDLPEEWQIGYGDLRFNLKPFSFKHTGLFPEQAVNWDWFSNKIREANRPVKVLNLFAYTGGATLSAAAAGASVTHVDASKGMVNWAKENAASSGLSDRPVRWLIDDCVKFVEREIRRGNKYDAIIMDP
ncbi:MAG: class I SAM-dependent methyltransferase, partial [Lachnospiraceae bacterium]|nr:class I SAM-dependent methyltransferase [Lachnospiraceae bacterium]